MREREQTGWVLESRGRYSHGILSDSLFLSLLFMRSTYLQHLRIEVGAYASANGVYARAYAIHLHIWEDSKVQPSFLNRLSSAVLRALRATFLAIV